MNKIVYLATLITSFAFGQNKFVEIEVKDSIHLKPIKFEYLVKISQDRFVNYSATSNGINDSSKVKMRTKLKELGEFLKSKNYTIRPLYDEKYEIHDYAGFWSLGYAVELSESRELENLVTTLKQFDFITGNVGQITYDEEELWEKRLFKKLIAKAKMKVKMVAELTGQEVGEIIEFREGKFNEDFGLNIKDVYLVAAMGANWSVEKNTIFGNRWKTAVFKFATK